MISQVDVRKTTIDEIIKLFNSKEFSFSDYREHHLYKHERFLNIDIFNKNFLRHSNIELTFKDNHHPWILRKNEEISYKSVDYDTIKIPDDIFICVEYENDENEDEAVIKWAFPLNTDIALEIDYPKEYIKKIIGVIEFLAKAKKLKAESTLKNLKKYKEANF